MHKFIYPNKDTWITELTSSANYGGDEILELEKVYDGDTFKGATRILSYFDITAVSKSINDGTITNPKCNLRLYSTEASALPTSYTLSANAMSQSWEEGSGKYKDYPITSDGITWEYGDARYTSSQWELTSGFNVESGSLSTSGGGVYFTGSGFEATQTFSYQSADVDMDITDIFNKWMSGSSNAHPNGIPNNGLLIKYSGSSETGDSNDRGNLKFFSRNTHTIYFPKLEIKWDDSTFSAGDLGELDLSGATDNHVYVRGIKPSYKESETVKFRIGCRERNITKTFSTSYQTATGSYIQSGSGTYSITDLSTNETIIPFGAYTSMSCDSTSNYFLQDLNTFQPYRFYKISLKVEYEDGQEIIYDDDNFEFKVVS
tara:strand:+ start:6947 stop:8068 length:1122 start_codon:yes stop_codon:yes gene_type:complete